MGAHSAAKSSNDPLEIAVGAPRSTAELFPDRHVEQRTRPTDPENPEAATTGAGAGSPETLQAQLSELQARHAEVSDAYLRAKAEAENTRRRAEEEMSKARKFAIESFAESPVPVKDSLEAAIAIQNATNEQLLEGVHATLRQLAQALERNKVIELNPAAGSKFDPHHHQAISMVPADQEANTVVAVLQKGYLIAERVLRPALVTVAAPK
ncbi:nucleotide exchange factor GrpE [Piscinibacter aquaticus]|uniref:Protein GrpE n=1 Tax=Piscinibacter aquaticus TaxID=392597 RepID=A0A5C6U2N0_9BURK|nr:nucleotide exchange factor GrpE [Piscinibacter aquaticus]